MRFTLRSKLAAIVATAAIGFLVLMAVGAYTLNTTKVELAKIEGRYLPKVDLKPRLEGLLGALQRSFQDAVSARDLDALAAVGETESAFRGQLAAASSALDPVQAAALSAALEDYTRTASDVSRRLIRGETGTTLVDDMSVMQSKRARVAALIGTAAGLDRAELAGAFREAARAIETNSRVRIAVSSTCFVLVLFFSVWLGRGVLRALAALTTGFARIGTGDFGRPIVVETRDELMELAGRANEMAANLRKLSAQRDRTDWLKTSHAALVREIRGDLAPEDVATRVVRFVASAVGAPAAALYENEEDGALRFVAGHGVVAAPGEAPERFRSGEGLVGQAALQEELTIVADPPAGYLRVRSALGEGVPRALVLMPLSQGGRGIGVLELAVFAEWAELHGELLMSVRDTIASAMVAARARAATRALLAATQRQAERLATQEEELRATNEELQAQEEELRQANADLSQQTQELDLQRRTLAERNAELDHARIHLEQRAAQLMTVSAYKSQFLANMSHELRTPLNSMLLLSNLLSENEEKTLTPRQAEFARTIYSAGKDLLALINQVLDLAKIESGQQEVEVSEVRLQEVIDRARRVFAPLAREKALELRIEVGRDLPDAIRTDRRRLDQILTNLIGNAIKFTSSGEVSLCVQAAPPDARVQRNDLKVDGALAFVVSDTGPGIAPEDHERVFTPFEQLDGAVDRRYGGTGLGLGIARELASLLGGELQLESALGRGSTFTLYLPRELPRRAEVGAKDGPLVLPQPPRGQAPEAGPPVLLLIEDDPVFAETFAQVIEGQKLTYVRASTGQEGLRLARERQPRGIILDVRLPDMDGWRVMEKLRADPALAKIPVHFVSALDAAERGLALGAVGYLTKPVSRQDLLQVIDSLVPRAAETAARFLVVEDDGVTADSVLRMLESERLEARRVSTAGEALTVLGREAFGCMILDLSLPDMNGLDLLRALREEGGASVPKVVVYTARALSRAETMALEAYAEAIVVKDGSSVERLLDEVRLFVRGLREVRSDSGGAAGDVAPPRWRFEGRTALIVDDDMRTVFALSATLRAKGLEVLVADTGQGALEVLDERPNVDVVLMDIMMPEMDGYEAMRRIRADRRFADVPIIALTAKAMKGDEEKCVAAGASRYLPKPIDADRLLAMIAACQEPSDDGPES